MHCSLRPARAGAGSGMWRAGVGRHGSPACQIPVPALAESWSVLHMVPTPAGPWPTLHEVLDSGQLKQVFNLIPGGGGKGSMGLTWTPSSGSWTNLMPFIWPTGPDDFDSTDLNYILVHYLCKCIFVIYINLCIKKNTCSYCLFKANNTGFDFIFHFLSPVFQSDDPNVVSELNKKLIKNLALWYFEELYLRRNNLISYALLFLLTTIILFSICITA